MHMTSWHDPVDWRRGVNLNTGSNLTTQSLRSSSNSFTTLPNPACFYCVSLTRCITPILMPQRLSQFSSKHCVCVTTDDVTPSFYDFCKEYILLIALASEKSLQYNIRWLDWHRITCQGPEAHILHLFFIQAGTDAKFQPTTLISQFHKKIIKIYAFDI